MSNQNIFLSQVLNTEKHKVRNHLKFVFNYIKIEGEKRLKQHFVFLYTIRSLLNPNNSLTLELPTGSQPKYFRRLHLQTQCLQQLQQVN